MKIFKMMVIVFFLLFFLSGIAQESKIRSSTWPGEDSGLVFSKESEHRLVDSSYTEVIQLLNLTGKVQALQFRLSVNKANDDSTLLILNDIQKGSDLKDESWMMNYNVKKGIIGSNGVSRDEIYILLYNSKQNNGLPPGNYYDLINVNYKVNAWPDLKNEVKSSMKISDTQASTFDGFPIDIKPTHAEIQIIIKNK